jgi:hypothetical protein
MIPPFYHHQLSENVSKVKYYIDRQRLSLKGQIASRNNSKYCIDIGFRFFNTAFFNDAGKFPAL